MSALPAATAPRTGSWWSRHGRSSATVHEVAAGSVLVEFCGLPGAGKSTLADLTQLSLNARGVRSRVVDSDISASATAFARYTARLRRAAEHAALHPAAAVATVRRVAGSQQPAARDSASLAIQWLATARLSSLARHDPGTWLLQEGSAQTLYTMLLRSGCDTSAELARTLPTGLRADLVVCVDVPVEEALRRLGRRRSRHSRTQHLPRARQRTELQTGRDVLRQVLRQLDAPTLHVHSDRSTSPVHLADEISAEILRLPGPR